MTESVRAVWPDAAHVRFTRDGRRPTGAAQDYLVLPGARSPRWLVPAEAPFTSAALGSTDGGPVQRASLAVLRGGHRAGLVRRLPVPKVRVTPGRTGSVLDALEDVLGPDLVPVIRLGRWRDPRALVLRVFARDGTTRGFVKLAMSRTGRASLDAEAAGLDNAARLDVPRLLAPRVLHRGSWGGHELLVTSPLLASGPVGAHRGPPLDAMRELAAAGTPREAPLSASDWWARSRQRLSQVADPDLRRRLGQARDRLERAAGDVTLALGWWHGDWTPWNMARDGSTVLLWDWEHAADDVPVGFDPVHYLAQQLRVTAGTGPGAEQRWRRQATELLGQRLGLDPTRQEALLVAYLLDVNLRFVLDRQATSERGVARSGWGLDLLAAEASRL